MLRRESMAPLFREVLCGLGRLLKMGQGGELGLVWILIFLKRGGYPSLLFSKFLLLCFLGFSKLLCYTLTMGIGIELSLSTFFYVEGVKPILSLHVVSFDHANVLLWNFTKDDEYP